MTQQFDNKGQIALWTNEKHEKGGKAPYMKGSLFAHRDIKAGEKIDIGLWLQESDNPKAPKLKGKIADPYKGDGGNNLSQPVDDEIPF